MSKLFIAYALFLSCVLGGCNHVKTHMFLALFSIFDSDSGYSGGYRGYGGGGGYHK